MYWFLSFFVFVYDCDLYVVVCVVFDDFERRILCSIFFFFFWRMNFFDWLSLLMPFLSSLQASGTKYLHNFDQTLYNQEIAKLWQ